MYDRLTLATSTGLPLAALAIHVAGGTIGLVAGWIAIAARKGGTWHRRSGLVFVYAMIVMGLMAVGIAVYEGKPDVAIGAVAAYLILTAWTTVRPLPGAGRHADIALTLFASFVAVGGFAKGFTALGMPGRVLEGVPAGMHFVLPTIVLLAVIGDARMIRAGGLQGARRLARHLWRMCFGLFIASFSFVVQLVAMASMPRWMNNLAVILFLAAGPLVVMLYWMWRVRLRQNLRGLSIYLEARSSAATDHA